MRTFPTAKHGFIKSFDGTKLFYSVDGSGVPLVFCYGLVCSSLHWSYQIEYFRKNFKTIWFDYRGHQNSEKPSNLKSVSLENLAKDLKILLEELNISKAVFLGHSMGVNVVLEFYKCFPDQVMGLVLANGTPQGPLETLFSKNLLQGSYKIFCRIYKKFPTLAAHLWKLQEKNPLFKKLVKKHGFNPSLTSPEAIEIFCHQIFRVDFKILMELIKNYEAYGSTSWLHTIAVPTLILAGENDKVIPKKQQELMHQLIPESTLEVIQHGSHCPQMDLPELVNLKIENFIKKLSSPTKGISNQSIPKYQSPVLSEAI